jgi:CheY-like chemotaxis protein
MSRNAAGRAVIGTRLDSRVSMPSRSLSGRRVLVVENDYYLAMDTASMLERAGARVIGPVATVEDGLAALEQLPDTALLDLRLRDEMSLPIAKELQQRGIPFVFVTGYPDQIPPLFKDIAVCMKPTTAASIQRALAQVFRDAF